MKRKRRILVTLESRATYGYSKNVMMAMKEFESLELVTLVTGMHLVESLGHSIDLIRQDGFPVDAQVPMHSDSGERHAWSSALGQAIAGYAAAYQKLNPDIILLSGDRIETFGCCVAAAYMRIPLAHIQAGDKSGHIDDAARAAIGKLAHIHLASCEDSADRLRKMGEQLFRIHNVGAPQLDDIVNRSYEKKTTRVNGVAVDLSSPYLLLVHHPVLADLEDAYEHTRQVIDLCLQTGLPVYCIYPNSDLGYLDTVRAIDDAKKNPKFQAFRNVDRDTYLELLANSAVLAGNSSSGILEAPSFKIPVVNIGERQRGRPQAANIINAEYDAGSLRAALAKALSPEFRRECERAVNPYGDGNSSRRICEILESVEINKALLDKQTVY